MKHVLTAIAILATLSLSAQNKKAEPIKIDSVQKATDSTGLIQYRDYLELQKFLNEIPAKYANPIMDWFQQKFAIRMQEFEFKKKKQ